VGKCLRAGFFGLCIISAAQDRGLGTAGQDFCLPGDYGGGGKATWPFVLFEKWGISSGLIAETIFVWSGCPV
jgi:hypothetical protein